MIDRIIRITERGCPDQDSYHGRLLTIVRDARDPEALANIAESDSEVFDRLELAASEHDPPQIRAAESAIALVLAVEGDLDWIDVGHVSQALVVSVARLPTEAQFATANYLESIVNTSDVQLSSRLHCAIGRAVLYGSILRQFSRDAIEIIDTELPKLTGGMPSGDALFLSGWALLEKQVLGGPGGLDDCVRKLRERIRER